jgi:nitrate reductase alpha subunit
MRADTRPARCPKLVVVERDYSAVADKMTALGPLLETVGSSTKGVSWKPLDEIAYLRPLARARVDKCSKLG